MLAERLITGAPQDLLSGKPARPVGDAVGPIAFEELQLGPELMQLTDACSGEEQLGGEAQVEQVAEQVGHLGRRIVQQPIDLR